MKGVYVALIGDEPGVYAVTLDGAGKELTRERLRAAGGQLRFAPPPPPARSGAAAPAVRVARPGAGRGGPPPNLPLTPPVTGIKADDWNLVEILLDATLIRPFLNESLNPIGSAAVDDANGKFGPVALYVGGTGEVRYRGVGTSDLSLKTMPVERTSPNFRMQRLNDMYYSWGAAVADFNGDGVNDVAAGPYYFIGPDFTKSREIYLAQTINASTAVPGRLHAELRLRLHGRRRGRRHLHGRHRPGPPSVRQPEDRAAALGQVRRGAGRPEGSVAAEGRRWRRQA